MIASQKTASCCDRASSFPLEIFTKDARGWGFWRYTANYLVIIMALLMDNLKVVLEKWRGWRGGLLYQRRDHRVSLRYTPCSTDNVEVLF